ncbi:MAG: hypothetical protein KKD97_03690, partial [Gammaproteobacteria bacterium]|nr:hypothetical protein [Gammaproteobacteria bacterium]
MEKIEVGYAAAFLVGGLGIKHKYIVYTDSNGQQFYARGGPGYFGPGAAQGGRNELALSVFGNVTTESGAYTSGTPDWDSARDPLNPDPTLTPHPRETILDGNDLSGYWESIKNTMQRVNQVDVPYNPLSSNSNAAVDEALREAQLPSPALDGPENYWSPGSDYDLPGGNVQGVADADKVWSDFQRWLNNNDRLQDFTDQIDEGVRETLLDLSRWLQNSPSKIDQIFREAVSIAARDPLAIDLDGDQIETVAINPAAPILFDHNGDGIKTSTGWLKGDDAWLVHDINNNGTIDSGKELLGVDTDITIGGITRKAASGFEALAALDGNGDHVFNADDAAFTTLRLWQDLNQNGISEANELSTLASKGIISIDLTYTSANENLGGGNSITGKATVTRTTGTTELDSVIVTNDSAANLNLADNPFYSELPSVPVTNTAGELPEMRGSGMVNSLRQAMSLDTGAATALSTTVAAFAQGQTRDAQMAVLDNLLQQWGATSSFVTSSPFLGGDGITQTGYNASLPHAAAIKTFAEQNPTLFAKIITLERFNGTNALTQLIGRWGANLPGQVTAALEASYKALQDSVYYGLAAQTRLKSYFDAISVEVTSASIEFSSSGVTALLNSLKQSDERAAMLDLVDLAHFSNAVFKTVGLDARALLADWLSALPSDSTLHDLNWTELLGRATSGDDFLIGGRPVETINAGLGNDWIYGGLGNDYLLSDLGSDTLHGGGGDDTIRVTNAGSNHIYGGEGKDTIEYGAASSANWIEGGAGNDTISAIEGYHPASQVNTFVGGAGNDFITAYQSADTYIFNRGDGADTIWDYGSVRNGILPSDDTISFGD